jgi:hypothetical protein
MEGLYSSMDPRVLPHVSPGCLIWRAVVVLDIHQFSLLWVFSGEENGFTTCPSVDHPGSERSVFH